MNAFTAIVGRDLKLAVRYAGDTVVVLAFFVIAAVMFAFGVGPEAGVQARMAGGVVWTTALLSVLMSLDRLFAADFEDGALEQMIVATDVYILVAAKVVAHWLITAVPLMVVAPLVALSLQLPTEGLAPLILGLALGTPVLSLFGAVGGALVLGARRGGVLVAVLLLPLYVPILIFGAAAVEGAVTGVGQAMPLQVLAGLLLAAAALCPWATAAALRAAAE